MPTYQYACTNPECANRFELVQSFTDPAATECPVCASAVRKVYGAVGVVFKGSGFYRTDSRAGEKSKSSSSSSSEKSGSSSEKSGDSSSTTTPAPAATFSSGPDKSARSTSTGAGKSGKAAASA